MPQSTKNVRELQRNFAKPISFKRYFKANHALYVLFAPAMLYFLVFKYVPLAGLFIAFKDFDLYKGIWNSEWVGLKWFEAFFQQPHFRRLLWNTLIINCYQLVFSFPLPIIFACLLNELRSLRFKRAVQTIIYLPHFLSWSIIYGLAFMLLSSQGGLLNNLLEQLGSERIAFLQMSEYFRGIIITSGIWKDMGWGTIIYLAALAGVNPALYEAAKIDGAGRWKQFVYITLPCLVPATMILLLLQIGNIMDLSFEQIWIFLTPTTYVTGDVLDTFSYRVGLIQGHYSFTTAIGLFKSLVGFLMVLCANQLSKWTTGESLY